MILKKHLKNNIDEKSKEIISGKNQNFLENEKETLKDEIIMVEIKKPSMKWFDIFTKFILPLWLVVGTVLFFIGLNSDIKSFYGSYSYYFTNTVHGTANIFYFALFILTTVLLLTSYLKIRKLNKTGYKFMIAYLFMGYINPVLTMFIYTSGISGNFRYDYKNALMEFIGTSFIYIPNIIYFMKRKFMFYKNEKTNIQ